MMLKSVISKYSGPSNYLLEWAYRGIVVPSLAYGSIAWHTRLKNLNVINKLRQLNRLAMLLLTQGVYKSTPTKSTITQLYMTYIVGSCLLHLYFNLKKI